jgi:protein-disulfide isomerase
MHKDARLAHLASVAAGEQGKFWEFHDKLFENQKQLKRDSLLEYAQELELNIKQFEKSLDDPASAKLVDKDMADAGSVGATGTPAFFVNGRHLGGAKPFADFATKINAELKRLKVEIPAEARL